MAHLLMWPTRYANYMDRMQGYRHAMRCPVAATSCMPGSMLVIVLCPLKCRCLANRHHPLPAEARGSLAMHCWRPHPSSGTACKSRRTLVCPLCGLLRRVFKSPTLSPVAKRSRPASTRSPSLVVKRPCCLPPRRLAPPTEEQVEPEDVDRGSPACARAPPTTFPGARAPPCLMPVCPLRCKECDTKLEDVDRGSPARARAPPKMFPGARAPGRHRPQGP